MNCPQTNCICCGEPAGCNWFCVDCTKIKETAYKESAALNEDWVDVIIRRDKALLVRKQEANHGAH